MMKKYILVLILFGFSNSTYALCSQLDLQGTWRVYVNRFSTTGQFIGWRFCRIDLDSSGNLIIATSFCKDQNNQTTLYDGGKLTIQSSCAMSGTIDKTGTERFAQGWLSRDKLTFHGVGKKFDNSKLYSFDAVKQ